MRVGFTIFIMLNTGIAGTSMAAAMLLENAWLAAVGLALLCVPFWLVAPMRIEGKRVEEGKQRKNH